MSLSLIANYIMAEYEVFAFIPAAILCYLPMRGQERYSRTRIFIDCLILLLITFIGSLLFDSFLPETTVKLKLLPFLVIGFLYYVFSVRALVTQCAAMFMSVCTICAIATGAAFVISERILQGSGNLYTSRLYAGIQLGLIALFCLAFAPSFYNDGRFLVKNVNVTWVWLCTLPYSALIFVLLVFAIPADVRIIEEPYLRMMIYAILVGLSAIYVFSIQIFSRVCQYVIKEERFQSREQIYQIQRRQYEDVYTFIEQMHVLRHDTRHMMRNIAQLARSGDTGTLLRYLNEKEGEIPDAPVRVYCKDSVLNAIFNYFAESAQQDGIDLQMKVDLPALGDRQAVDLADLFSNLLENAVLACREIPKDQRMIALTVRTMNGKSIYIVSTNTFSGQVRLRKGEYQTTRLRNGGTGIGLHSMRNVAERYHGSMKVYHEGCRFFVDILMDVAEEASATS